ncbi:MAG: hypothetical protein V8T90_03235 [Victivallales bacterium]
MKQLFFSILFLFSALFANAAALHKLSMDAMDWDVDNVVYWQWIGKSLNNLASGGYVSSRTVESDQPFTAQITLIPKEKLNREAAEASLVLRDGKNRNAWHLTLRDDGKNRTLQLSLRAGRQTVKLPVTTEHDKAFRWNYNVPYTLTLTLEHGKAIGTVSDKQEKLLCKVTADAGKQGDFPVRAAVHATTFRCTFRDPGVSRLQYLPEDLSLPPQTFTAKHRYRSPRNVSRQFSGSATGFFHISKDPSGQYWFIDPDGKALFLCGVDGLTYAGRHCELLGYSPYLKNVQKIFGNSREKWGQHTLAQLNDWGFNYAGTCEPIFRTKLPFSFNLMIGSSFASFGDDYDLTPYRGRVGTAMPNPFHPRFAEWCKRRFIAKLGSEISNPYLVGYFSDNEMRWLGNSRNPDGSGLFDDVMKKHARHSAKQALIRFLAERYQKNITAFNQEWNLNLHRFSELEKLSYLPHHTPAQLLVKQDFLTLIADTYFSTVRTTIREIDPNHLFLGCRFAGIRSNHERVWRSTGKFCDVVSFNQYPIADLECMELYVDDRPLPEAFSRIHNWSGRPLMITEWAFLGLDSGLPCTHGAGHRLLTQRERSAAAELFYRTTLSLPFMAGINWYEYGDDPKLGVRKNFPENSNYGLVNVMNEPYAELTSMFRTVNTDIDGARREKPRKLSPPNGGALYKKLTAGDGKNIISTPDQNGITVSNGKIMLQYRKDGRRIHYFRNGKKVGEISFLLRYQQSSGKHAWPHADTISGVRTRRLRQSTELSFTASGKTEKGHFQLAARLLLPDQGDHVISEVLSLHNQSPSILNVHGIYFTVFPAFQAETRENFPRVGLNLYRKWAAWYGDGDFYLGAASGVTRVHFLFYQDNEGAGIHPDGYHPLTARLSPGELLNMEHPCYIFIFSGYGDYQRHARKLIAADLQSSTGKETK